MGRRRRDDEEDCDARLARDGSSSDDSNEIGFSNDPLDERRAVAVVATLVEEDVLRVRFDAVDIVLETSRFREASRDSEAPELVLATGLELEEGRTFGSGSCLNTCVKVVWEAPGLRFRCRRRSFLV